MVDVVEEVDELWFVGEWDGVYCWDGSEVVDGVVVIGLYFVDDVFGDFGECFVLWDVLLFFFVVVVNVF